MLSPNENQRFDLGDGFFFLPIANMRDFSSKIMRKKKWTPHKMCYIDISSMTHYNRKIT